MTETTTLRIVIGEAPPARLDKALARDVPRDAALSRSRLARMIAAGAVSRAGEVLASPTMPVAAGDVIEISIAAPVEPLAVAQAIPLAVVFEDEDLIVIDKPAGMVVHPAPGARDGTLVNALLAHCGDTLSGVGGERRPGIVHRIDKDTSGLLVVAKTDRAHHGLAAQFADHSAARQYLAVIHGVPQPGDPRLAGLSGVTFEPGGVIRLETLVGRHRTDRQRQAVLRAGGRHAVTRARVLQSFGRPAAASLIACWLETGRTHQIRVHMAHAGHPLLGDRTYGTRRRLPSAGFTPAVRDMAAGFPRQALHAATLGFVHPVTQSWMAFEAPLPQDMQELLDALSATPDVQPHAVDLT